MALTPWQRNIVDESGNVLAGASVEVRRESDAALATLYDNPEGTGTPLANPLTADGDGFVRFYTAAGAHRITATSGLFSATWRHAPFGDAQNHRVGVAAAADVPTRADADARYLMQSQNLADIDNAATARGNLGLGTAAVLDEGTDPDDLPDVATVDAMIAADIAALSTVYQPLNLDLTTIAGLGSTGFLTKTGVGTWAQRTLTGTDRIAVINGEGVAGNPTFDLQPVTASRALVSDVNGFPSASAVTSTELGYISGIVAPIQQQFAGVAKVAGDTFTGNITVSNGTISTRVYHEAVTGAGGVGTSSNHPFAILVNGVEAARFSGTNRNLLINTTSDDGTNKLQVNGNISVIGGGIKFPATQVPSADANTLDDYKEGTWTPDLRFGGSTTGIAYSARGGTYTKIGNVVICRGYFALSSKGSATGSAELYGLPFTVPANGNSPAVVRADSISHNGRFNVQVEGTTDRAALQQMDDSGNVAYLSDGNFANTSAMAISVVYQV